MHICHVTPHLPPDQAANALLPHELGRWARQAGNRVTYVAHPPRAGFPDSLPGAVHWVPRRGSEHTVQRVTRIAALVAAVRIARQIGPVIADADLVHIHSNGLLTEMSALLAVRKRKPSVLTLYGTEIWHYRRRWPGPDLFTSAYHQVAEVTFYSVALMARARELGLARPGLSVVYPPVADAFRFHDSDAQRAMRRDLGWSEAPVLLNVKRLHPLAGHRFLVEAMPAVLQADPRTRLFVCGTGPLADELRRLARALDVDGAITFTGLVDNRVIARYCAAADVFVLPSLLEACPTVALEALASGTPVVSSDSPGGAELSGIFGPDVVVAPRENAPALATAIVRFLDAKRRTEPATARIIERDFRPAVVAAKFRATYERALETGNHA